MKVMHAGQNPRTSRQSPSRGRRKPRPRRYRFRPTIEQLEEIVLLSTVTWINLSGGDWDTPSNWQDQTGMNRLPGPGDDAVINVAGGVAITHAQSVTDTVRSLTASDPLTLSFGTLVITGSLSSSAAFQIAGGTLSQATVASGTTISTVSGAGGTLNQVTLAGTLDAVGGFSVTSGITMQAGSLIQIGNATQSAELDVSGDQTISGTGEIRFTGNGGQIRTFGNVVLGAGITVHGSSGLLYCITGSLTNQGTIESDSGGGMSVSGNTGTTFLNTAGATLAANGGTLDIGNGTDLGCHWSNLGQISVNNSTLNLGDSFTTAGLGSYTRTSGTINLVGILDNTSATLALNAATGSWTLLGGTLRGGDLATADGTALATTGNDGTLDGVTLGGTVTGNALPGTLQAIKGAASIIDGLTLANGTVVQIGDANSSSELDFHGQQTVGGTGEFRFVGHGGQFRIFDNTLTLGSGITIHGVNSAQNPDDLGIFLVSGSLVDQATIQLEGNNTLSFTGNPGTSWIDAGPMVETNSMLNLGGTFSLAAGNSFSDTNGFITIDGTLINQGATLALNATTGSFDLISGRINGGTISTSGGSEFFAAQSFTLDGVALAGSLEMIDSFFGANVTVLDGLTLQTGTIRISHSNQLAFSGTQTLGGTGSIDFADSSTSNSVSVPAAGTTLTIGPGITIRGNTGKIDATNAAFANQGTIASDAGGTITAIGAANFSAGTLTGGTWQASASSTLRLSGDNIITDAATLLLDGSGSHVFSDAGTTDALAGLAAVARASSLTLQNGAQESTTAASFGDAGTVAIGSASSLTVAGTYTQTAGSTTVNGMLASAGGVSLSGGTLNGDGTVQGNFINASQLTPGNMPGILTITGKYTQTSAGVLNIEIGGTTIGTQFDQLDIQGSATLDGTLNITLINGFGPAFGQTFPIMSFASSTGAFSTVNGLTVGFQTLFTVNQTATSFVLNSVGNASDLAFASMTIPSTAGPGQDISVSYTVNNLNSTPAMGDWYDSVYLSSSPVLDPSAQLLGRVHHVGDVAGNGSYSESLTAPVPNVANGNYHVILLVDSRGLVADLNRQNNTGVSTGVIQVNVPILTLGTPVSNTIANGQDIYYGLVLTPGADVTISASFAAATEAEFYLRYGLLPDRSTFDQMAPDLTNLQPQLTIANAQGGNYYILLHGREGAGGGQPFTIRADDSPFGVFSIDPTTGSNQGQATIDLTGARFSRHTVVSLVNSSGTALAASAVLFIDSAHLSATFDLTGLAQGSYQVRALDGMESAAAPTPFTVDGGQQGTVQVGIMSPSFVRVGAPIPVLITVFNDGHTDLPAPLIDLTATNVAGTGGSVDLQFSVWNSNGQPGTVPPLFVGASGAIFRGEPQAPHVISTFQIFASNPSADVIDWDAMKDQFRPSDVSPQAWDAVWANFRPIVGNTVADLYSVLRTDWPQLAQVGDFTQNIGPLIRFELEKAADDLPGAPVIGPSADLSLPAPGLPLAFVRSFGSSIPDRYRAGRLGPGWTDNFDISATQDSMGLVTIREGIDHRSFAHEPDGSYTGFPGDSATLTSVNGVFRLRETDGTVLAFRPDGSLDYIEDTNGNRISAGYTGSELTSLTHSDGSSLTLMYNAQGLLSQVTDSTGEIVTYGYDTSGQLTSVVTVAGTTAYTYTTDPSGPHAHALASTTSPDGTHLFFDYDSAGRETRQQRNDGAEPLTFSYGVNSYSVTDALGNTTTVFYDDLGRIAAVHDPLGRVQTVTYDSASHPVAVAFAGGGEATAAYDSQGNVTSAVDQLGAGQNFAYEPAFNRLSTWTDANGNMTVYAQDGNGNLTNTTYADGSTDQFSHDAQGNITQTIDRSGQPVTFTYDSRGLLLSKTFADGTHVDYTYDPHGNLLTATDASGTITLTYDSAARLTQVTYPSGQFLRYSYDSGGRRTQLVDQNGFTVNYSYDAVGRLAGLTDESGGLIVNYSYDAAGRPAREDRGNGTYTTYEYDADGELLHLVHYAPDNSVQSRFDYTYDSLGRQTSVTTLDGTTAYGYDAVGRLVSVVLPNSRTITYQYDAAGNRVAVTDNGATTSYTTNDLNEYTQVGGQTNSYDADGDLLTASGVPSGNGSYTYNDQGQLVSVTTAAGTWSYQYDALGNRIAMTHDGQTTQYLVDPTGLGSVIGEYDGSGQLVAHYNYGLGLTSRVAAGNTANFYDFDGTGSTIGLSGSDGAYVDRYSYLPFGETLTSSGSVTNPFRFNGQLGVADDGNGLNFMRARFYDSAQGRFIQPDPIGLAGGSNSYAFVANNPVMGVDPAGLQNRGGPIGPNRLPPVLPDRQPYVQPGGTPRTYSYDLDQAAIQANQQAIQARNAAYAQNQAQRMAEIQAQRALNNAQYQASRTPPEPVEPPTGGPRGGRGAGGPLGILAFLGIITLLRKGTELGYFMDHNDLPPCWESTPQTFFGFRIQDCTIPVTHGNPDGSSTSEQGSDPHDPNNLSGPAGFGAAGFVRPDQTFPYTVYFENDPTARGPAAQVVITEQLDPNLDWSTFQLGDFGFGSVIVPVPAGRSFYHTRLDERSTLGLFVDVTAGIDVSTGVVTWTFTALDPTTLDIPADPRVGFLPPDDANRDGEGFASYFIRPRATDPTSTTINAQASVVFDTNAPINTPQVVNTIDAGPPTSSVQPLPATITSTSFTVSWSGQDDAGGSGIASFDIFVSDNGGPFTPFLTATSQTSAVFTGQFGHSYAFYSVATDNVGHRQATPSAAQATTQVVDPFVLYVTALYHRVLDRNPSASEVPPWVQFLHSGGTQVQVAQAFWTSAEHRGHQVDALYHQYLNRAADPGGRAGWVGAFLSGMTENEIAQAFLASPEYQNAHLANTSFIDGLYASVLGRAETTSERNAWLNYLQTGGTRDQMEDLFLTALEHYRDIVDSYYAGLLDRAPDARGETGWAGLLSSNGNTSDGVAELFLISSEFFAKATAGSI
jgi:RHS repeat-associated protein